MNRREMLLTSAAGLGAVMLGKVPEVERIEERHPSVSDGIDRTRTRHIEMFVSQPNFATVALHKDEKIPQWPLCEVMDKFYAGESTSDDIRKVINLDGKPFGWTGWFPANGVPMYRSLLQLFLVGHDPAGRFDDGYVDASMQTKWNFAMYVDKMPIFEFSNGLRTQCRCVTSFFNFLEDGKPMACFSYKVEKLFLPNGEVINEPYV